MKKILFILISVCLVFSLLGVSAYAESNASDVESDGSAAEAFANDTEGFTQQDTPTADSTQDAANDANADSTEQNVLTTLFAAIEENMDKILSALSFIGTVIIAFAYKKGILPLIKSSLSRFSSAISKISEKADSIGTSSSELSDYVKNKIDAIGSSVDSFSTSIGSIEQRLALLDENASELDKIKLIFSSELDVMYEIFMSSSLPQYRKDEIGTKVARLREELGLNEE